MSKAKAKVGKRGGIGISLSLNALIGILLAIVGAFLVFFNQQPSSIVTFLSKVIGVFLICIGAVGIVNYFKYKQDAGVLVIGICEIIVGILFMISAIATYFIIIIAAALIVYGAVHLFRYHRSSLDFITGIAFIVIGILVLITFWVTEPVFMIIVGIAALIGAVYFLFFA